jgi:hypothetical protein
MAMDHNTPRRVRHWMVHHGGEHAIRRQFIGRKHMPLNDDLPKVTQVTVDLRRNVLVLELSAPLGHEAATATIDIGALGRLIGVEVGESYLSISDPVPGSELQGRSVTIGLPVASPDRAIVLPRRGADWEISFPSGNQCWTRSDGTGRATICSVVG